MLPWVHGAADQLEHGDFPLSAALSTGPSVGMVMFCIGTCVNTRHVAVEVLNVVSTTEELNF